MPSLSVEQGMSRTVLVVTHDDLLWQHMKRLPMADWLPARGRTWEDLARWKAQQRRLVILDAGLPELPELGSAAWQEAAGAPETERRAGPAVFGCGRQGVYPWLPVAGRD